MQPPHTARGLSPRPSQHHGGTQPFSLLWPQERPGAGYPLPQLSCAGERGRAAWPGPHPAPALPTRPLRGAGEEAKRPLASELGLAVQGVCELGSSLLLSTSLPEVQGLAAMSLPCSPLTSTMVLPPQLSPSPGCTGLGRVSNRLRGPFCGRQMTNSPFTAGLTAPQTESWPFSHLPLNAGVSSSRQRSWCCWFGDQGVMPSEQPSLTLWVGQRAPKGATPHQGEGAENNRGSLALITTRSPACTFEHLHFGPCSLPAYFPPPTSCCG